MPAITPEQQKILETFREDLSKEGAVEDGNTLGTDQDWVLM